MSTDDAPAGATRSRRLLAAAAIAGVLLLALGIGVRIALQPAHVANLVLDRLGKALGLELRAAGLAEYRLRGEPMLVVRDVVAREPGATTPVLRARRILVSLPWSTVRARGRVLDLTRIELDAPQLDLPALQHWLATRPPSETKIPTLRDGVSIHDGHMHADGWDVDGLALQLPRLAPDRPFTATLRGRLLAPPLRMPFAFAVAMTRPGNDAGVGIAGPLTIDHGDWRVLGRLRASGPLHLGDGTLRIDPLRLALAGRYEGGDKALPVAFGVRGPLRHEQAIWSLGPAGLALRGRDPIPSLDARGAFALGERLVIDVGGTLATWPVGWPALPSPIGDSRAPLPFGLRYDGRADLSDTTTLRLQREATRFDGRLRLPVVLAWLDRMDEGSLLPPLDGRLTTPRLDIPGAQLEGVEIVVDAPEQPGGETL